MVSFGKKILYFSIPIIAGYGFMSLFTFDEQNLIQSTSSTVSSTNNNSNSNDTPISNTSKLTKGQMLGLMIKQNIESNRPAWDVRPLDLSKVSEQDLHDISTSSSTSQNQSKKFYSTQSDKFFNK